MVLEIPLRDKNTDISAEISKGRHFENFLRSESAKIAERVGEGDNLNEEIASLARRERLNRLQIQRFVEEVNTLSFNVRYKLMSNSRDRRVTFELAELEKILNIMGSDAPGEVINPNFPNGFTEKTASEVDYGLDKIASFDYEGMMNRKSEDVGRVELLELEKEAKQLDRMYKNGISKIANTIIDSELKYGEGNNVLLSILSDMFSENLEGDIHLNKKASSDIINSINSKISFRKEASDRFKDMNISLESGSVTSNDSLFGEYSLLEKSAHTNVYEAPKVSYDDMESYEVLVKFAADNVKYPYKRIKEIMEVVN